MDCNWLSRNTICNLQRIFLLLVWVPHTAIITNICTFVGCIVRNTSEVLDLFNKHPDNVIRFWMSCNRQQHTYTTHDVAMNARHTLASHNAMLYQCDLEIIAAARATATIFFFFFVRSKMRLMKLGRTANSTHCSSHIREYIHREATHTMNWLAARQWLLLCD